MKYRRLVFPDGDMLQLEIHSKYNFVTVIKINDRWKVLHYHVNGDTAGKALEKINRFFKPAGKQAYVVKIT